MAQNSPTIADILEWISNLNTPVDVNRALAMIVPHLMRDPSPVYAERIQLFQKLKTQFPNVGGTPIIPAGIYKKLPFPIAHTLKQANEHSYSKLVQLLFLFDAVEISIRWLIAIYVAVIMHENKGVLPSRLANDINGPIKRATFGKWIDILRVISGYVKDKNYWCISKKTLPLNGDDIDTIIGERNNVAHGNTAGTLQDELTRVVRAVKKLFKRVEALHLNNMFVVWEGKWDDFVGESLSFPNAPAKESNGIYVKYGEVLLKLPVLFFLKNGDLSPIPYVLGFVSTKAKLETWDEKHTLDYVEINGTKVDHIEDKQIKQEFITTFQTNYKISSDHPWKEELEKASEVKATAWEFEKLLIKYWKKEREVAAPKKAMAHILWFGGKSDIGRTTVLQGSLHPLKQEANGSFLFLHTFSSRREVASIVNDAAYIQYQLDRFLRRFRDAIVYWSQDFIKTNPVNKAFKNEELIVDCLKRLRLFLNIEHPTNAPMIVVGLDNIENMYLDNVTEQDQGAVQLLELLKRFHIISEGRYKPGEDYVKEQRLRLVFVATGRSSAGINDADDIFNHRDPSVEWLFDDTTLNRLQEAIPETKRRPFIEEDAKIPCRRQEIDSYYQELQVPQSQKGAHLPPIKLSGCLNIFAEYDQSLINTLTTPKGVPSVNHQGSIFLRKVYDESNGRPRYVDSIAQKLAKDEISIQSDLRQVSALSAYFQSRLEKEFISDERRILAFVLCLLAHNTYHEEGISFTVASLQMLHDWQFFPAPEQEEVVLRAIYSAQGLLQPIPQNYSNEDGTLVYAWALSTTDVAEEIRENPALERTREEVKRCIEWFQKNHQKIAEGTQLKAFFTPAAIKQNIASGKNANAFLYGFRELAKATQEKIISHVPLKGGRQLFQKIQSPIIAASSTWSPQRAWLQRCYEMDKNDRLFTDAKCFLVNASTTFSDLWLHQINAPYLPLYDHEKGSFLHSDKVEAFIPLSNGFYLIKGTSSEDKFLKLSLFHIGLSYALHQWPRTAAVDCCVTHHDGAVVIAFATTSEVRFDKLDLVNELNWSVGHLFDHPYQDVTGVITLPNHNVVVYGKKPVSPNEKRSKWLVEEISIANKKIVQSWQINNGGASKPLHAFVQDDKLFLHVGQNIVVCPLAGTPVIQNAVPNGAPSDISPILDSKQQRVGMYSFKGKKTNAFCSRVDCIPIQPFTQGTSKPVGVFEYGNDLLIVYINGTIALHAAGTSIHLPTELQNQKLYDDFSDWTKFELRGALLCGHELVVYGRYSFIGSITFNGTDLSSPTYHQWPLLHYGTGFITGVQSLSYQGYEKSDPSATWLLSHSDDNDIRLWDLANKTCTGLFRAHKNKIKTIQQYGNHLLSADTDKNVCVWEFNDSAKKQLQPPMLQRQTPYVIKTAVHADQAIVINQNWEIYTWPKQGVGWSQKAALKNTATPFTSYGTWEGCFEFPSTSILVGLIAKSIWIIDKQTLSLQEHNTYPHPTKNQVVKWKVLGIERNCGANQEIVAYGIATPVGTKKNDRSHDDYFVALLDSAGALLHYFPFAQLITAAYPVTATSIIFVHEGQNNQKTICNYTWGSPHETLRHPAFVHSSAIKGMYFADDQLLCWDSPSGGPTTFFYEDEGVLYTHIQNPNCTHGARNIHKDKEGIVFSNSDGMGRWRISLLPKGDTIVPQLLTLSSEMYVLENFDRVFSQKCAQKESCAHKSANISAFAESAEYGVNLFYKHQDVVRQITWIGLMMRGFSVGGVYPNGRILANQNREVIVLQLMRGNKEISFDAIASESSS